METEPFEIPVRWHGSGDWEAGLKGRRIRAESLETLDRKVRTLLRRLPENERPDRLVMRFETDGLPPFLRQYGTHYFNRSLSLEPPDSERDAFSRREEETFE